MSATEIAADREPDKPAQPQPADTDAPGRLSGMRDLLATPEFTLGIAVILVAAALEIKNPIFGTWGNIRIVTQGAAPPFMAMVAATYLMVGGGLDLSVGSVAALTAVVTGKLLQAGVPVPLGIGGALALCVVIGLVMGVMISRFQIPALIVTLGGLYALNGVALQLTAAQPVSPLPNSFNQIAQGDVGPVPLLLIYAVVVGVLAHLIFTYTTYGYRVRAVGGNAEAALAAGINVTRIRLSLYVISAVGAGLTGILFASQIGDADPSGQSTLLFTVISAVIIGGTSLFGGRGTIVGTALGVLLLTLLANGLVLLSISAFYQQIVVGIVVVGAVGLDGFRRTRLWSRHAARQGEDT
jgi:ribose/xylose/arabinose/galactoside ABC-type transport system permease subunit